ncbi:ribonuclease H1 domain-containing protein [Bowmanella dokdonensis]|uniref:ribonuclease H n=1 Tax=Bowmanella dokdonensis TaxID=751969 RepID=A0A939DRE9_9ALTE|nr:ribonuclease H family protein [Bowmanella dokdonensis]MBN7827364.1 viroplasmin family protein [Bowmanella dokdonensis]
MPSYYAVRKGHKTGVFETWSECQQATSGFPKAEYKKFKTREEAEAFAGGLAPALVKPKLASKPKGQGDLTVISPYRFPVQIYTDGACDPNPGSSGSGLVVYEGGQLTMLRYGLHEPQGTNNSAELIALREALKIAPRYIEKGSPVEILSDSDYSLKAVFVWAEKWSRNDWQTSKQEPVKNADLIRECVALAAPLIGRIQVTHVAAHNGTEGNELADRLAMQASIHKVVGWSDYGTYTSVEDILQLVRG